MLKFPHWLRLILLGLLSVPSLPAQTDENLPALVQVLGASDDPQFHLDILKGLSDGLKGRRGVTMPAGWAEAAARLGKSPNAQVRDLVQSLSLTFGSASALNSIKQTLLDFKAEAKARLAALDSLLAAKDPSLGASLQGLLHDPVMRAGASNGATFRRRAASRAVKLPLLMPRAMRCCW